MLDLLLDQVAPSVSALLAEIHEPCRLHLTAVAVAPIEKPLLTCDLEFGKGRYILGPTLP
jgi:hypothetical protein